MHIRITTFVTAFMMPVIVLGQTHESAFGPNFPPWRQCLLRHVLERDANDGRSHQAAIDQAFAACKDLEDVFFVDVPDEHHDALKQNIRSVLLGMLEADLGGD